MADQDYRTLAAEARDALETLGAEAAAPYVPRLADAVEALLARLDARAGETAQGDDA